MAECLLAAFVEDDDGIVESRVEVPIQRRQRVDERGNGTLPLAEQIVDGRFRSARRPVVTEVSLEPHAVVRTRRVIVNDDPASKDHGRRFSVINVFFLSCLLIDVKTARHAAG